MLSGLTRGSLVPPAFSGIIGFCGKVSIIGSVGFFVSTKRNTCVASLFTTFKFIKFHLISQKFICEITKMQKADGQEAHRQKVSPFYYRRFLCVIFLPSDYFSSESDFLFLQKSLLPAAAPRIAVTAPPASIGSAALAEPPHPPETVLFGISPVVASVVVAGA